jgi:hypothetical protein
MSKVLFSIIGIFIFLILILASSYSSGSLDNINYEGSSQSFGSISDSTREGIAYSEDTSSQTS